MSADSARIRALTWNVHGFVGRDGRRDPEAVMSAVGAVDADIVALQEIDERRGCEGNDPAFVTLREAFGRHSAEARTIRSPDGDYGHLLMSRWPMHESTTLDLSVRRREPRVAISCRIEAPHGDIRVVAAHLGLSARERLHQIAMVRDHLEGTSERAAIVLGDFNEWHRFGAATRAFRPEFRIAAARASYPARFPLLPLDRIWCRRPLAPVASSALRDSGRLSDHLAIVADLVFEDDAWSGASVSCSSSRTGSPRA
jgi:endonuclease/exonuclease/phosphatase family metal-dependent hydrolase